MRRNYSPGKIAAAVVFVFLCAGASAQQTATQSIYWIRYQNQLIFSRKLYWNNEVDNRRFFGDATQHQLIIHSRVHVKQGRWDFGGGLTSSWAYAQYPDKRVTHPVQEVRPVVEATHEHPIKKILIQNRVRVDHRFFEVDHDVPIYKASRYTARLRYRLQVRIPLIESAGQQLLGLRVADEVMFNHRENLFDQNRIYVSTDLVLSKKVSLETGYLYIYQQRFGTADFFHRHVVRFSVLHKIEW